MTQAHDPTADPQEAQAAAAPAQKKYPLGVLFVHGIGEQPMGDTLKNVVDPVVKSLDLWVHGAVRHRALSLRQAPARAWADKIPLDPTDLTRNAALREHAAEMVESVNWLDQEAKPELPPAVLPETPWGGSAVLRDGEPAQSGNPAHAVLHLQTVDEHYQVTQSQALLAECWWARSFVPPSAWALLSWTFKVLPLAIGMHVADLIHGHTHKARDTALGGVTRFKHRVLALLWLLALSPIVMLALPGQVILTASVVLSLLPIRFVQDAMRALQSVLIGTLGDSFLLVSSPVSRAMIVAQCKRDLQWLAPQCEQVLLVAHSQGCAVSYLALCEHTPAELTEVSWLGSGLRKLEVLRLAERNTLALGAAWLVATMPLLACGVGHNLLYGTRSDGLWERVGAFLVLLLLWFIGYHTMTQPLRIGATGIWIKTWQDLKLRFRDIYASHDPVPHGPLSHTALPADGSMVRQEVRNLASRAGDHTSYWRNVEEVSLPLALRMARAMGMPLDRLTPDDDARRQAGVLRRHQRVNWLVGLRAVMWAGALGLVLSNLDLWLNFGRTALAQGLGWDGFSDIDFKPLLPSLKVLGPELLLWWVLPYAAMTLIWSGWESHEQRAFLMRQEPSYGLELISIVGLVGAVGIPFAGAAINLRPEAAAVALVSVVIVALGVGFPVASDVGKKAFSPPAKSSP